MSERKSAPSGLTTRETFELVGNETRAEILRVLAAARGGGLPPALSFSELRDRIDADVGSSQFNYHLSRLIGEFVEDRSEGSGQLVDAFVTDDSGYALSPTGTFLTRLLTATSTPEGVATDTDRGPIETDTACHYCGQTLRAQYANRTFRVWCPACEHQYTYTLTPPGLVAGAPDTEALLDRADGYLRHKYLTFARGTCPLCANAAPPEVLSPDAINWPRADRVETLVRRRCDHCGNLNYALLGTELLADPAVAAACYEAGQALTDVRLWALPFAVTDRHTTVESASPWRATLTVSAGDETLELTVDDELTVLDRSWS